MNEKYPDQSAAIQEELPLIDLHDVTSWPGYQEMEQVDQQVQRFKHDLRGVVKDTCVSTPSFVGRWAMRVGLPLLGVHAAFRMFPYATNVDGIDMKVQGSVITRPGFSADTSLGNWEFPHVDGLPLGAHVSPSNVKLIQTARDASQNVDAYTEKLQHDFENKLPLVGLIIGSEVLGGVAVGAAAGAGMNAAFRHWRQMPRRERELMYRGKQAVAIAAIFAAISGYGAATYNKDWAKDSRLSGTLAEVQAFPSELEQYYDKEAKGYAISQAVLGIQDALQSKIDKENAPETAYNIMFISDMHLGPTYPLVEQYIQAFNVKMVVNTGDEAEFGSAAEMTPQYIENIKRIAKLVPYIYVAGNHDSPTTVEIMRSIPGVIVLGTKELLHDEHTESIAVTAGQVDIYGLRIGGVPDPRVYGGPEPYRASDAKTTDPLERAAVDESLKGVRENKQKYDVFTTHEPVAVDEINKVLPDEIRLTASGHLHEQNKNKDLQPKAEINLVEGSTGEGGLDHIGTTPSPMELSILSVAANCQFTKIIRVQQTNPSIPGPSDIPTFGENTVMNSYYFKPQDLPSDRTCSTDQGIGPVQEIIPGIDQGPATMHAEGKKAK